MKCEGRFPALYVSISGTVSTAKYVGRLATLSVAESLPSSVNDTHESRALDRRLATERRSDVSTAYKGGRGG